MRMKRSRRIAAPVGDLWSLATDPHHLPRWWPATQRVENVSPAGWTTVSMTPRGRTVRADYSVATTEPPHLARWRQDLEGTPFERLFSALTYELHLVGDGDGTEMSIAVDQQPRGWARLGVLQLRGAARRQLDSALEALAQIVEAPRG